VRRTLAARNLDLMGLHCHLGSPIFELEPYETAIEVAFAFAAQMAQRHGLRMREFSPGGGFAIQYVNESPAPPISEYARAICDAVKREAARHRLPLPRLLLEPGRAIVGQAGVALYTVGSSKDIDTPQLKKRYVALDGGMADNIRPAIYGSRYEAVAANHVAAGRRERVTLAGKYCESGDILVKDIELPRLEPGDLVAIPASGAYCIAMSSNYNAALKPPIALVKDGKARLIRRRETVDDLLRCEV
jgi:diaminopimelate decarboxylase